MMMNKNSYFVLKLGVSALFVGLIFRLYFSRSGDFSEVTLGEALRSVAPAPVVAVEVEVEVVDDDHDQIPPSGAHNSDEAYRDEEKDDDDGVKVEDGGKCDLFNGDWVPHPAGPIYTNETCEWIEGHQNCMKNGRPDSGYLYWRWSPRECELPRMNPERFLELMRNKAWALIGDSISRNHVQSLICMLSKVEKAVQIYHDEFYKSKKWIFPSYNFTVSTIWSPFLGKAAIYEDDNGISSSEVELHLDKLDPTWSEQLESLDYIMFSSGEWYVKSTIYFENDTVIGCHYCSKRNLTQLGFVFAYGKVLTTVFNHVIESNPKGMVFFRTTTADHFENGEWFSGGVCNRTEPAKEGEFHRNELNKLLREVELEEFRKASLKASEKGVNLRLFDVNPLSLLRPDGHPGPYRFFQPFEKDKNVKVINDCLHWCLPGPIDSWNDLVMEMVVGS